MDFKPIVEKVSQNKSLVKQAKRISDLVFDQNKDRILSKEPKSPDKIKTLIEEFITSLRLEKIIDVSTEVTPGDAYEKIILPVIRQLTN